MAGSAGFYVRQQYITGGERLLGGVAAVACNAAVPAMIEACCREEPLHHLHGCNRETATLGIRHGMTLAALAPNQPAVECLSGACGSPVPQHQFFRHLHSRCATRNPPDSLYRHIRPRVLAAHGGRHIGVFEEPANGIWSSVRQLAPRQGGVEGKLMASLTIRGEPYRRETRIAGTTAMA